MYVFIINPAAGNGRGEQIVQDFIKRQGDFQKQYRTYYSQYPGHAKELASQIARLHQDKIQLLFVVGGDGTLYEVLNGLKHDRDIPISFIPVGSGNDFARGCMTSLNPKVNLRQSIDELLLKPYWFGQYVMDLNPKNKSKLFASSIGFGFDAEVAERVNASKMKAWFNRLRLTFLIYVIGLIMTIFTFKPKDIELNIDGNSKTLSNVWMITINNHPYFGGGMKIAPDANINPHTFHVTIVKDMSKWKILLLFVTVFFGKHTSLKEVETLPCSSIGLKSEKPLTYHADGFTSSCYQSRIEKELGARQVIRK
ncbi:diacylglycerol/lipid kinase family protein [Tenuibacillus multivorans]|uniref:Lipid kinase, YegS/Rv2252/BmrU family n=1 Tax=Tenuibacillus multivorans TaxID=237069 RepID=A0A1H0ED40_9BACI|nr:diacylglycerol kinase family protein [Tenuibacillus multivorans]GEL77209.1 putative lipid kinase YtlR [Tenuibacillus multivorans]SDN80223.1 lipid kinase, YegS/Rv2252/BmrU family [Tenuibacillus multivorans]